MSKTPTLVPNGGGGIEDAIAAAIESGAELGVQAAVYIDGDLAFESAQGWMDRPGGRPVDAETLFPVFSVTKAVTATALHIQAERGFVDYDQPIARYWPQFAAGGKQALTVRQALTHRLGMPQMPDGVTPEAICDWDAIANAIAAMTPLLPAGTSAYMPFSYGWILGEIVRRTDPKGRAFGAFIQEEICAPLDIADLWVGIPDKVEGRIATVFNDHPSPLATDAGDPLTRMRAAASPPAIATARGEEVWGRPDVRRACIGGANGIANARSLARFFAMLANEGSLGGVRLLSAARVRAFAEPRPDIADVDAILGRPIHIGMGGYYLGGESPPATPVVGTSPRTLAMPGSGGSIAWADPDRRIAVALCHNRMHDNARPWDPAANPFITIGEEIRAWAGDRSQ